MAPQRSPVPDRRPRFLAWLPSARAGLLLALTLAGSIAVVLFRVPDEGSRLPASLAGRGAGTGTGGTGGAAGAYRDGMYRGASIQEPWGAFQVQATVAGGRLVEVTVLVSPQDRRSSSINQRAFPTLRTAVLARQSAQVDVISGATWTSESYAQSLQAALDQARR